MVYTGRAAEWATSQDSYGVYVVVYDGPSVTGGAQERSLEEQYAPAGSRVFSLVDEGTGFTHVVVMAPERLELQSELVRQHQQCFMDVDTKGLWALDYENRWQQMREIATSNLRLFLSPYELELCLRRLEAQKLVAIQQKLVEDGEPAQQPIQDHLPTSHGPEGDSAVGSEVDSGVAERAGVDSGLEELADSAVDSEVDSGVVESAGILGWLSDSGLEKLAITIGTREMDVLDATENELMARVRAEGVQAAAEEVRRALLLENHSEPDDAVTVTSPPVPHPSGLLMVDLGGPVPALMELDFGGAGTQEDFTCASSSSSNSTESIESVVNTELVFGGAVLRETMSLDSGSNSSCSGSSNSDNSSNHQSKKEGEIAETWVGASTYPFDRGKRSPSDGGESGGAVVGISVPFDRGKVVWIDARRAMGFVPGGLRCWRWKAMEEVNYPKEQEFGGGEDSTQPSDRGGVEPSGRVLETRPQRYDFVPTGLGT